jgi:nucleoid-associated protein YgaU
MPKKAKKSTKKKTVKRAAKRTVKRAAKRPAKRTVKRTVKKAAKKTAKRTVKKAAKRPAKKTVKKAAPKPAPMGMGMPAPRPAPSPMGMGAPAPAMPMAPAMPKKTKAEHTVAVGDSLRLIALKYYGPGGQENWKVIYDANKAVIGENPYILKPGQILKIPEL